MAKIELIEIAHRYVPGEYAVQDINLTWEDGVASALLGPSGCGKTTLLKIISGLLKPSEGRVLLDGVDVTDKLPRERNIAQVFQFPSVYETLNVFDNLAFPLRNRRVPEAEVLGHPHQGIVRRLISMWMVFSYHLPDHGRGFAHLCRVPKLHTVHCVEYSTMHRLEPIAHIRQSSSDYGGKRVSEIPPFDLFMERGFKLGSPRSACRSLCRNGFPRI